MILTDLLFGLLVNVGGEKDVGFELITRAVEGCISSRDVGSRWLAC